MYSLLSYCEMPKTTFQITMLCSQVVFLFAPIMTLVESQPKVDSFHGHVRDLPDLESSESAILWIAPDDVIVTQTPDLGPIRCPGSNLRAIVTRALRLSSRRVVLRPFCQEGLLLYKSEISVLVDVKGPTYCALIVSSADRLQIMDTTFDHGDCVNASARNAGTYSVLTVDSTAAVVLRPQSSRLDSQTSFQNLTFRSRGAAVAVLLSPPTWRQTLQLDGPSFSSLRSSTQGMRFVALLTAGSLRTTGFEAISVVILRDPIAGLDRPALTSADQKVTDLWQYLDAQVLMRLRQTRDTSPSPSKCSTLDSSTTHSTTLVAIGFSLTTILAACVVILLVHSCRSTEARDMAPYRTTTQGRVTSTS